MQSTALFYACLGRSGTLHPSDYNGTSRTVRRIDPLLIDAAHVFHTRCRKTWLQIYLPMMSPGFLQVVLLRFH